jgi:hypothetical protein
MNQLYTTYYKVSTKQCHLFYTTIPYKAFAFTKVQTSCTLTADGFVLAKTMNSPAMSEFDIHIFEPFII